MSEPERTVAKIHEEYTALCARAGHLQYRIFTDGKDLELLNQQLRDLNLEAANLSQEENKVEAAKEASSG